MEKTVVVSLDLVLFCVLAGLTFVGKTSAITCDRSFGPSGFVECVNLYPFYSNRSQWVTCVTDSYMRQQSKGHHFCSDDTVTYCLYECMLESHNIGPRSLAPVYDDCDCGSDAARPIPTSTLSPWCLSPSGQGCNWYRECLEPRHPCEGTSDSYAITYGENFCNRYTENLRNFSKIGQDWVNAVRKCLQVKLVPILRPWVNISCKEIQETAFDSHSGCYLSPNPGAPSICDLPISDWWKIFWTINSSFISAFRKSVKGLFDVIKGCGGKLLGDLKDMVKYKFHIERENFKRQKRSTSEELDQLAGAVADAIASKLSWRDAGIIWYAYSNSSTLTRIVPVEVLITGKGIYDLGSTKVSAINLTAVTENVVKAIHNGDLFFRTIGENSESIYVKQMTECVDFECKRAIQEVTAPPNKYSSSALGHINNVKHTIFTYLFFFASITFLYSSC